MARNIIIEEIKIAGQIILKFPRLMNFNCFRGRGRTIECLQEVAEGKKKGSIIEIFFAIIGRAICALLISMPTSFFIDIVKCYITNEILASSNSITIVFITAFALTMHISLRIILKEYNEVINYKTKQSHKGRYYYYN